MIYFEEEKLLPFSNSKYKLNIYGEILEGTKKLSPDVNGSVVLNWLHGERSYKVDLIIAMVKFNIPIHLLDKVEVAYDDLIKDKTSSMFYRFKDSPIEVNWMPGFYYIPHYTDFCINLKGEMVRLANGSYVSWNTTKYRPYKNITGGYKKGSAKRSYGTYTRGVSRHRMMGLAFCHYNGSPFRLVMNHKNGIPGDDYVENLEWVTRAENNQHAIDTGLTPNSVNPILVRDNKTNLITKYTSIAKCCRDMALSEGYVYGRLNKRKHRIYLDGLSFKLDDGSEWATLSGDALSHTGKTAVVSRHIFTGAITIFNSIEAAASSHGVWSKLISENVNKLEIIPVKGYNYRYLSKDIAWPNHNERHLAIYKNAIDNNKQVMDDGIIITDDNGNETGFFVDRTALATTYNVSYQTISRAMRGIGPLKKLNFSKYKLLDNLGPSID